MPSRRGTVGTAGLLPVADPSNPKPCAITVLQQPSPRHQSLFSKASKVRRNRAPAPGGAVHCAWLRRAPFAVTHEHEQQHVSIATASVEEGTRAPAVPEK